MLEDTREVMVPTAIVGGAIDCDVHPAVPEVTALFPYLDEYWRMQIEMRGIEGLDLTSYPPSAPLSGRPDWRSPTGKPGSDFDLLRRHALDGFGTSIAICNCLYGAQAAYNEDFAAALCRAVNDWLVEEWLARDPRLRASIVVPLQSVELAVAEIERRASDTRFVQVLVLAMGDAPLGRRMYWPVYAAAERHGLPIGIHAGSSYRFAPTALGWPSYYIEDYACQSQAFQAQVMSLVAEGVFTKYPGLRVVLIESGVSWLPALMWRSQKLWRSLRHEVPWLDQSPPEIIREHIRLTIQPFDGPSDPRQFDRLLNQIGSEEMLLFSTDYPHWQFDGGAALPEGIGPDLAHKILRENPLRTYPRLKESMP
jgi:predicted TIM-barrel fold metal-dependent hydrolase